MKKLVSIVYACYLMASSLFAQQLKPDSAVAVITFEKDTANYGTIEHDADGYRVFNFTNMGKAPLIIENVQSSCGCLVPTWPKGPIQPGQGGVIKAHYDTHRIGRFIKTLTVTSNAINSPNRLYVVGNVLPDIK